MGGWIRPNWRKSGSSFWCFLKYNPDLLTPTWPLCKNIISVDYERSISFRKCNRCKSFEIVHVCLNNKKCYNIQYDYDVGQWRLSRGLSEHCLRSESRVFEPQHISFFNYYIGKIKLTLGQVARLSKALSFPCSFVKLVNYK